jgi:hypothetical protein
MKAKNIGIKINFRDIFNNPTIIQLAQIAVKFENTELLNTKKELADEKSEIIPFKFSLMNFDQAVIDELADVIENI